VSNTWITCLEARDNPSKDGLIPDKTTKGSPFGVKGGLCFCKLILQEGSASYQLVGEVTAHQGEDG
jgi:hypothetical protein